MVDRYVSSRASITHALTDKFKTISTSNGYLTDLAPNAYPRLKFWDEVDEFPSVHLSIGSERREYQGGGYKDRFLSLTVRCYVKGEDPELLLEQLLRDLETVIEENGRLAYQGPSGTTETTHDIIVVSIETDQGVLAPLGVGEILLQVRY